MTHSTKTNYPNNHESRITRLEVTIENINESLKQINNKIDQNSTQINNKIDKLDNRIWQIMFFIVSGFAALLAVMAHGFKWL